MPLRLTTADENAPDSEQLIPPSHSRAKRIFVGMAVSALTQVRLCPTLHGRDARATKVYFQERHTEDPEISQSHQGSPCLSVYPVSLW